MINEKLLQELQEYINKHLVLDNVQMVDEPEMRYSIRRETCNICINQSDIDDFVKSKKKPSFNKILFKYIDKTGLVDSVIYNKAGIDRRLFSKIRSKNDYHPSKNTVIALALSLELDNEEADELLSAAGYSLSDSETFDLVIMFCLERKIYKLDDVNQALDYFSLKPLCGVLE